MVQDHVILCVTCMILDHVILWVMCGTGWCDPMGTGSCDPVFIA